MSIWQQIAFLLFGKPRIRFHRWSQPMRGVSHQIWRCDWLGITGWGLNPAHAWDKRMKGE
jgi:hypothetical protein